MSNLYTAFLGLIPSYPTLVGTVKSVNGEFHKVELLGGGTLICQSQKAYTVGQKIFLKDKVILSEAPNNTLMQFRV